MATNGGARPGAGRPRKADKYARPIAAAEKRIADHLPELVDRMMELANGVLVEETDPLSGQTNVYKRPPDRVAAIYLIDRIMGKPKERSEQDVTLQGGVTVYLPQREIKS